jgi:hypothetical protein
MHLSDTDSPGDLVKAVLIWFFGPSSLVVVVFLIVTSLLGWGQAARSAVTFAGSARARVRDVRNLRPAGAAALGFAHLALLVLQALWLVSVFAVGVILSSDAHQGVPIVPADFTSRAGASVVLADRTPISVGLLSAAALALVVAYRRAARNRDSDGLVVLFGGLPFLFAWFGVIGAAISALMWALGAHSDPTANGRTVAELLGCAATMFLFHTACQIALSAPLFLTRARQSASTT